MIKNLSASVKKKFERLINLSHARIFIGVFLTFTILRFIFIDSIPPGMQYDELEYALSSKTFQLVKSDVSGTSFPESLIRTETLGKVSPIPYMIFAPLWTIFELNLKTYRSAYVVLNLFTSLLFGYWLYILFKKHVIGLIGTIIFLVNPWSYFLSRHAIDGAVVLLFYLLGMVFFSQTFTSKRLILGTFFFLLGLFSYHGAKLQLIPLLIIFGLFGILFKRLPYKVIFTYISVLIIASIILLGFLFSSYNSKSSILSRRSHEIALLNAGAYSDEVVSLRTASISSPIHEFVINKWGFVFKEILGSYFDAYSLKHLFLTAEIMQHIGFFYLIDFALILSGLYFMSREQKPILFLTAGIILIAPMSSAMSLSGLSILNRGILLLPSLLIPASYGYYRLMCILGNVRLNRIDMRFAFIFLYGLSICVLLYAYYLIMPIQNTAHYRTSTRVLARYLVSEKTSANKIIIISPEPQVVYLGIIFYLPHIEQEAALLSMQAKEGSSYFALDNIVITGSCVTKFDNKNTYIIDKLKADCFPNTPPANQLIVDRRDAATEYFIIHGNTCSQFPLSRWIHPHYLSDLKIESMSEEQFCLRWISTSKLP